MVRRPSDKDLIKILKTSSLPNCPVTPRDVIIANKLFGPDIGATRRGPPIVDSPMSVDTTSILEHYGEVTLCVDLMYVNKVPLLVTLSHNIKFGTMEAVADRKEAMLLKCIKGVISLYRKARFKVTVALMDGEFVSLRGGLAKLGIRLNETSRDEHVSDIEQYICTVKERMRAIYNTEYAQTHKEHNNSMNPRTVGSIALRLVGNGQGSFYFLSVSTGRVLNRLHATALPMPDDVIDKLHRMVRQQKSNPGLVFADRNLNPEEYDDDDDDETYHDNDNGDDDDDDDLSHNEEDDDNVDDDEEGALGPPAAGDVAAPDNDMEDDGVDDDGWDNKGDDGWDNKGDDDAGPLVGENDDDDDEGQADTQPSAEVGQPPDAMTLETAGAEDVNQDEQQDGPDLQGTPGVSDEEIEPETPGVSAGEDDGTGKDGGDQPTLDEIMDQVQPAQPGENNGKEGRYKLLTGRKQCCLNV